VCGKEGAKVDLPSDHGQGDGEHGQEHDHLAQQDGQAERHGWRQSGRWVPCSSGKLAIAASRGKMMGVSP
jgi:hypothetical protein